MLEGANGRSYAFTRKKMTINCIELSFKDVKALRIKYMKTHQHCTALTKSKLSNSKIGLELEKTK